MTTSRTWMVLWPEIEPTPRKYQEPVSVERVLADHRAALAAVPISEGMDTSAAPIAAHAADTQAGEGLRHCGSPAEGRRTRAVRTALPDSFPAPLTCCLFPTMSHENNQVRNPENARTPRSQFPVRHTLC